MKDKEEEGAKGVGGGGRGKNKQNVDQSTKRAHLGDRINGNIFFLFAICTL